MIIMVEKGKEDLVQERTRERKRIKRKKVDAWYVKKTPIILR